MSKKVLIVTYYWPPSGGGGVQRWLKFAKYLPDFDWQPIIFTPENPGFDQKDETLSKDVSDDLEVLKFPIWEPYQLFKRLSGRKELKQGQVLEEGKTSFLGKVAIWVRGNLLIPDPRRFWIKPSVEYLHSVLESNEIKTIITTGPPHSMHLIGMKLRMKDPTINWVADFRDPWSEWDILDKLKLTQYARRKHRDFEKQVVKVATKVLIVSPSWEADIRRLGAGRTAVITNGFDHQDIPAASHKRADKFRLCHAGMLNEMRNPKVLWEALEELTGEIEGFADDLQINLIGILSDGLIKELKNHKALRSCLLLEDYIPHAEVFKRYAKSEILLLILNDSKNSKGHLPGKLFEYLAMQKTIMAFGLQKSDAGKILSTKQIGRIYELGSEVGQLKEDIKGYYLRWKSGQVQVPVEVNEYERKNLTAQLAELLNEL